MARPRLFLQPACHPDRILLTRGHADPAPSERRPSGPIPLRGWAIGRGEGDVARVEVSTNSGDDRWPRGWERWTWTFWEATLELGPGQHLLEFEPLIESGMSSRRVFGTPGT